MALVAAAYNAGEGSGRTSTAACRRSPRRGSTCGASSRRFGKRRMPFDAQVTTRPIRCADRSASSARAELSQTFSSRLTLTGCGVRSSCANRLTRSSSSSQRNSSRRASGAPLALGDAAQEALFERAQLGQALRRRAPGRRAACPAASRSPQVARQVVPARAQGVSMTKRLPTRRCSCARDVVGHVLRRLAVLQLALRVGVLGAARRPPRARLPARSASGGRGLRRAAPRTPRRRSAAARRGRRGRAPRRRSARAALRRCPAA